MLSFDNRLDSIPDSLWRMITHIDEIKGQWSYGASLGTQALGRLKRSVLVTSTGASTRIEGARLSDEDVEGLMRGLSLQKLADRDTQEVRGYYEALRLVFDSWDNLELSENHIKQLHSLLLQYADKDQRHRGHYKTMDNKVEMRNEHGQAVGVVFDTTSPYLTPKKMQELVDWTNDALKSSSRHPLLVIGNFIVELLRVHPFLDGNGRLSRILTNLLMLRAGYSYVPFVSHERLVESSKVEYYLALRRSQKTFDSSRETIQPWLDFFIRACDAQAEQAMALLSADAIERLLSPSQLLVWNYLGAGDEAAPGKIASATGVPRSTVAQALDKLLELGKIERLGLGRATRYRRVAD
jgi:Fic family protein